MARFPLLIFCLLCMSSCMSKAAPPDTELVAANGVDETAAREVIFKQVKATVAARDFAGLSAMEDDFRASRARTPSGISKLGVVHASFQFYLAEGLRPEDGCEYRDAQIVKDWAAAFPRNPAPVITDAALLLAQGWCFRGVGYADSVSDDAWPKFEKGAAAAAETLRKHRKMASADPEYYAVLLNVMRAQGADKPAFHDVVDEATTRDPTYDRTYFNAAWYYLPQWGGSYEEVDAFARYAADRTRASDGTGYYARIFWWLEECGCQMINKAADWPTMKQGLRDIYNRYPLAWNGKYAAELACRHGDVEEGRRFYRAIHPEAVGEGAFAALFASCDKEAETAG
jgi:hypothetical protein